MRAPTSKPDGPRIVGPRGDQPADVTHSLSVAAHLIPEIRELWRCRQAWHRAEKSLTLQAKALCRRLVGESKAEADVLYKAAIKGGDHPQVISAMPAMAPLLVGRDGIERARKQIEKRLVALAKQLPVAEWVEAQRGVGLLSLAGLVGEAGDLSDYSNPAKLWKRMGLAVLDGQRQRKASGPEGLRQGYNPRRRSLVWTIGDCIIRAGGPLKLLYDERKVYELPRVATKAHAHNRAKRYIEKRLLRDAWKAWRTASEITSPIPTLPASALSTDPVEVVA